MSVHANAARTFVSLDGDAFRMPMGTALTVASPLGAPPALALPYGGVEAGFEITPEQSNTDFSIWNAPGTYRSVPGDRITRVAFTPVDHSEAAVVTRLRGGSVEAVEGAAGAYEWNEQADADEFALILDSRDGGKHLRFWFPRVTLDALPAEAHNRSALASYAFVVKVLAHPDAPVTGYRKLSSWDPTAAEVVAP